MSLWEENNDESSQVRSAKLCDVVFKIECRSIPVDHAAELTSSLCNQAPWLATCPGAGVHPIHVAGSQNGWQRPEADSGEPLILSKRTRLRVRVPVEQSSTLIEAFTGTTHTLAEHTLTILSGHVATLQSSATLLSRYTFYESSPASEDAFLQQVIKDCESVDYRPTKLLCGKSNTLFTPDNTLTTRSLLIADVPPEFAIPLQEIGLGDYRLMGCGILIPHKDTGAV